MRLPLTIAEFIKAHRTLLLLLSGILSTLLVITATLVVSSTGVREPELPPHSLTVMVKDIRSQLPVTTGSVEVVLDDARIFMRQPLDASGSASFRVRSGTYLVRMASGYTGEAKVRINSHYTVPLEVIQIVN